jgi:general stress protein 26
LKRFHNEWLESTSQKMVRSQTVRSNNGDVTYDGTSYYFTFEQARTVRDIQANPKVALGFTGNGGLFSDAIYVAVEGSADLVGDKAVFKAHWTNELDRGLIKAWTHRTLC